jgi:predicted ribosome quality control (RQC) complex YloA/Tae2 family protein
VELRLDPNYSAQQNARDAFHRYRRARRIQEQVPPLLEEARREREYLEGVLDDLERAESLEDLRQVEEELLARGHIGRQAGQKRRPAPRSEVKLSRLPVADGPAILYGKTGTQNDELVRLADGDDLWFHVKDAPGGHVLIRTGGRPEAVPPETLEAAAALAAALSRRRTESRVEVNYALAKHVRKPRGAPPGFVTYTDFKTLSVRPRPPG